MTCNCGECVAIYALQRMGLQDELDMMVRRARVRDYQNDWARVQVNDARERIRRRMGEEEESKA